MELTDHNRTVCSVLHDFKYSKSEYWYVRFAVDKCHKHLAIGNEDGEVYVWSLDKSDPKNITKKKLNTKNLEATVRQLSFSQDGNILIAVCDNSSVYRWDLTSLIK